MKRIKRLLPKQLFGYFRFFYKYLGNAAIISLVAAMFVAILDGIGLTMFLPLLQAAGPAESGSAATPELGEMDFVLEGIQAVGIPLNITSILAVMLVFFCLKGIAKFCADYYTVILRQRFANKIRLNNMVLLAGYDYRAFSTSDSGRIQNTFSGEVERLNSSHRYYFLMLQNGIMTLVYISLAYLANPRFAIIVAVGGVVSNLAFKRIYAVTKDASRGVTQKTHSFQGYLIESVSSFKFLKATNLMEPFKRKVDAIIKAVENEQRRVGTMNSIAVAIREPIIILIVVVAILLQVKVFGGALSALILSLLFFYRGLIYLISVQNYYNSFLGTSGSIENMEAFVADLEAHQEMNGEIKIDRLKSGLLAKNLTYGYDDHTLLKDLKLRVDKNRTLGIVGESGTGKTTLVNILCGLLKVKPGMLFIDDVDITQLDVNAYRKRIGYVTQEAHVFSDSIFNNVTFWEGRTPQTEARAWKALKLAHADGFVRDLPGQLDTVIGINGVNLSGGQRQRISIARELYRDIDILVMDEATSALDSQSENLIQENIESLSGTYTMIVIAHRLSTIRNADQILYLKPGGQYEIGTFTSLCNTSSTFKNMVALQSVG
ncbi:subfamily B ATP-binding cassette protein MsbA [Lewinella marina]|uniref:ABC transporter ATP-binding protein n=1 Tax=Neolewinella marina TaxID=438751 RepID=A0A2G0CBZ0_9BACT|nr:ABC transporter ATP-binding protein [Neolewinella marina]NJB86687.1 subfamily B ATP-binding cassette protein MsbA [Neolewinella marina]PHK97494.1 hypothetical protein CGL56_15460 [Neolewinella marina]